MKKLEQLNSDETEQVSGGLLAGALAGGILGGTVGLICATGYGIKHGTLSGTTLGRAYVTCALSGAAIGCFTPV